MKLRNSIIVAALAFCAAPALADIVRFDNVTSAWTGALPPGCCTIDNTSGGNSIPVTIRWGTGADANHDRSGYNFTNAPQPIDFTVNPPPVSTPPQLIGSFNHLNFPITGVFLASVELDISGDISISTDGGTTFSAPSAETFKFNFKHDETPNTPPCPVGDATQNTPPCADLVTVSPNATSATFMVGGVQYTLDILGFSTDGGTTIKNQFITIENQQNQADLFGVVRTTTVQVPEPASLALLGLGLLAAGLVRRKLS